MYSALRKGRALSCRKLAAAMKEKFPAVSSEAVSYAERPKATGITYTMEARRFIDELCNGLSPQKEGNRKDKEHISVWLPNGFKAVLNTLKTRHGFTTIHDYIVFLIEQDRNSIEKAACSTAMETSGTEKNLDENIT